MPALDKGWFPLRNDVSFLSLNPNPLLLKSLCEVIVNWLPELSLGGFCFVLFFVTRGCQESLWWLLRLFSMDLKFTVHRLKTWLIGFKAWLSYSLTCSLSKSLRLSLPQFLYSIENTVLVLTAFRGLKCIKVRKAVRLGLATWYALREAHLLPPSSEQSSFPLTMLGKRMSLLQIN